MTIAKPMRVPGDPAKDAKNALRQFLTGQCDVNIVRPNSRGVPDGWTINDGPTAIVADDGGPNMWPVATRPQIRFTVWAKGRTEARRLAGLALGYLYSARIPGLGYVDPNSGTALIDDYDTELGAAFASFTVGVVSRTRPA